MADPLSILGAIAAASQLAQQAFEIIKFFSDLYAKVQDADESIRTRMLHIEQLIDISKLIAKTPTLQTTAIQSVLVTCLRTTITLRDILQELSSDKKGLLRRIMKAVKAVRKEDKIIILLDNIERDKSSLALCIHQIDASRLYSIGIEVKKMHTALGDVSLVVEDTARNVQTVVDVMPVMAGQVKAIAEEIPTLSERIAAMQEDLRGATLSPSPKSKPLQYYEVPNRRVRNFVGRQDVLSRIGKALSFPTEKAPRVVVLRGMGGQGKSQVALEYCRMTKGNPFSAIFWVDASSESTVQKSFEVISERLKTQMDILLDTDARVSFVFRTLSDWPSPWFMVFDNYDNPTVFNNVEDYMPSNEQGMILVTSRNSDADKLADEENQIQLQGLPESDAIELLLKQSQIKQSDQVASENAKEIVARLGHHALAITQAGAYISKRKILLGEFLDHFERRKDIILKETPQMSQYRRRLNKSERETSLSVFTTWELSFQQLEDEDTERVNMTDILTLFAFFDCKDISEGLFKAYCDVSHEAGTESSGETSDPETSDNDLDRMRNTPPSDMLNENEIAGKSQSYNERRIAQGTGSFLATHKGNWDSDFFCDVLVTLAQLSLVQTFEKRADGLYHLSLHPLVKDWIQLRTKKSTCQEYSSIAATSIYRLLDSKSWNNGFNMSLSARQELHAHIDAHEMNIGDFFSKDSFLDCALEIEGTGCIEAEFGTFLYHDGQYEKSERWYRRSLDILLKQFGSEHPNTLTSMNNLAEVLRGQGKYEAAEAMHRRALELKEKVLGPEHPDTLTSMNNLALVLQRQGKYSAAKAMHRRALELIEKVLGLEHRDTLRSMNNLAEVLRDQGKYEAAEAMHRRALELKEKVLGAEHPRTLTSMNNLAEVLRGQGKYEAAEAMHRRALKLIEKVLGPEHPDTLVSMNNLAGVLGSQGKYEAAEAMHRRALKLIEKVLGPEHPDTLMSMNNLTEVLGSQGKYEAAEAMHRRVLELKGEMLGPEHPDTLTSINNLAEVLGSQGKYEAAEAMHRRVLELRGEVLGPEHPDTLTSMNNLAAVLRDQGKYEAAEAMQRRTLELREKVVGPEHPRTLTSMNNLAAMLRDQGKYEAAEVMHRRALELIEKVLGLEHPDTLTSMNNLAEVLGSQGKYEAAEAMHRRALELKEKVLGPEHPRILTSMNNLAEVLRSQGKYEAAEATHRRVLELRGEILGPEHPDTVRSMINLAAVLEGQGKYEAAEVMQQWALELSEKVLGPEHPDTLTSMNNLTEVLEGQGKYEAAEAMRQLMLVLDSREISQPPRPPS